MFANHIVILTGAGISRESGLSTFRDADGIWATVRIEDVATPKAFMRDPKRVHEFYNARTIELNLEPSEGASLFGETRYGPASQLVPTFVDELLSGQ